MATIILGLLLHCFVTLPVLMLVIARKNPYKALKNFMPALALAFGTSSSSTAMPLTMSCACNFGVRWVGAAAAAAAAAAACLHTLHACRSP